MSKTDFYVIALDETAFWSKETLTKNKVTKIDNVYLFDRSIATNCCEITLSYCFDSLYYLAESDNESGQEEIEGLHAMYEDQYRYYHCTDIDSMKLVKVDLDFEYEKFDDENYKQAYNEVREYCNCNHFI